MDTWGLTMQGQSLENWFLYTLHMMVWSDMQHLRMDGETISEYQTLKIGFRQIMHICLTFMSKTENLWKQCKS